MLSAITTALWVTLSKMVNLTGLGIISLCRTPGDAIVSAGAPWASARTVKSDQTDGEYCAEEKESIHAGDLPV